MADAPSEPTAGGAEPAAAPELRILAQYVKDMSFENPGAPFAFMNAAKPPKVEIGVDSNARRITGEQFEVEVQINASAKYDDKTAFLCELTYCGVILIRNVPEEALSGVLMIEGARILFPFARRLISDITRDGGYPPMLIDPVDFTQIFRRKIERQQAQAAAGDDGAAGEGAAGGAGV